MFLNEKVKRRKVDFKVVQLQSERTSWSLLTYDDGAGAQQPDLLLQRHPVGDFLLLLHAVRQGAVRPRAHAAAAVLSIHVRLPGSGPVRPSSPLCPPSPSPPSAPVLSSLRIHAD